MFFERQRDSRSSQGWFIPQMHFRADLGPEAGIRNTIQVSREDGRNPTTWAITAASQCVLVESWSQELHPATESRCSSVGCRHVNQQAKQWCPWDSLNGPLRGPLNYLGKRIYTWFFRSQDTVKLHVNLYSIVYQEKLSQRLQHLVFLQHALQRILGRLRPTVNMNFQFPLYPFG